MYRLVQQTICMLIMFDCQLILEVYFMYRYVKDSFGKRVYLNRPTSARQNGLCPGFTDSQKSILLQTADDTSLLCPADVKSLALWISQEQSKQGNLQSRSSRDSCKYPEI